MSLFSKASQLMSCCQGKIFSSKQDQYLEWIVENAFGTEIIGYLHTLTKDSTPIGNVEILEVYRDGILLSSSGWGYDPDTSVLHILSETSNGVVIQVKYR